MGGLCDYFTCGVVVMRLTLFIIFAAWALAIGFMLGAVVAIGFGVYELIGLFL